METPKVIIDGGKCAKVIVFYFGERRGAANNCLIIELLPEIIKNEIEIDNGYPTDTFFVINKSDTLDDNLLDKYDGIKTKNGKIRISKRNNIGMSFGGYIDTFKYYKNEYDYWMFLEDDVIVYKNNYINFFIAELELSEATFISLAPISDYPTTHCGGGCGLTSKHYMEKTYTNEFIDSKLNEWSKYKGYDVASGALGKSNAEVDFSSYFKLKNHSHFNAMAKNWKTHSMQNTNRFKQSQDSTNESIYKVGKD